MAVLGAVLLIGALFLPWYTPTPAADDFPRAGGVLAPVTAWQAFAVIDVLLAVLAVASVRSRAAAVVAAALVASRMLDPPAYTEVGPGAWLALAGALIAALAPWLKRWMGAVLVFAALLLPWYREAPYILTRGSGGVDTRSYLYVHDYMAWQVAPFSDLELRQGVWLALAGVLIALVARRRAPASASP